MRENLRMGRYELAGRVQQALNLSTKKEAEHIVNTVISCIEQPGHHIAIIDFVRSLEEFARISEGRSNPVERDNNPLSDAERDSFLRRVTEFNGAQFQPDFWAVLLEC